MLRKLILLAIAGAIVGLAVFYVVTIPATVPASALGALPPTSATARPCSTRAAAPPATRRRTGRQDEARRRARAESPFGTFYVPNISPDQNDGIGKWSEADFVTAMLKGTSPDGRHYFPAFPYSSYQKMRVEDVRDLFAHIKTLPAVQGRVRDHDVPFPFNVRRSLGGWKFLFLDGKPFQPDASQSAQWNRGAYLVNGPGHCAECHSPRNLLGGIIQSQRFAGGPNPEGEGWIPNVTQAALKDYSDKDIAYILETGNTPDGDSVGGSMAAVVRNTAQLAAEDRNAMAAYIKSLPPVEGPKKPEKK